MPEQIVDVRKGDMLRWSRIGNKSWYGIVLYSDAYKFLVKWIRRGSKAHLEGYTAERMCAKLSENYFEHYPRKRNEIQ